VTLIAVVLLGTITACSAPDTVNSGASGSPVAPIIMNIVGGQLVSLTEDTATGISPGAGLIVELGVFAIGFVAQEIAKEKAAPGNSTLLVIEQDINGVPKASIFKITTTHQLQIEGPIAHWVPAVPHRAPGGTRAGARWNTEARPRARSHVHEMLAEAEQGGRRAEDRDPR
jgi:hypothetical protein